MIAGNPLWIHEGERPGADRNRHFRVKNISRRFGEVDEELERLRLTDSGDDQGQHNNTCKQTHAKILHWEWKRESSGQR